MKLFSKNVYTDIELENNNEIDALKAIARISSQRLQSDEQEIKSGLLARAAMNLSETERVVLPNAYASSIDHPMLFAFTFTQPIIWGIGTTQSVSTVITLIMPRTAQWTDYQTDVALLAKHFEQPADVAAIVASQHDTASLAHVVNSWLPVTVVA